MVGAGGATSVWRTLGERFADPRFRRIPALAALVFVALVSAVAGAAVGSGSGDDADEPAVPEAGRQTVADRRTSFITRIVPPAPEGRGQSGGSRGAGRRGSSALAGLSLERKVAQVFLLGFSGQDANSPVFAELRRRDLGGVVLTAANFVDATQLAALAGEVAVVAREAGHVPPLVMAAQEGGEFNAFSGLPPATTAADLPDARTAAAEADAAGQALRPLGITGLLGPVVDVGLADGEAIGPRAFADEPRLVAGYARAVVGSYRRARLFAAVKHFPGLGSASQSTDDAPASVGLSLDELWSRDLVPFRAAIAAGAPGVVVGHGLYAIDDFVTPASLSPRVMTGLLRRRARFRGVAIADDLADPPVTALGSTPDAAVTALRSGADLLYISGPAAEQQAAYVAVLRAVQRGDVPRRRLDQAVRRVLAAKRDYGLVE